MCASMVVYRFGVIFIQTNQINQIQPLFLSLEWDSGAFRQTNSNVFNTHRLFDMNWICNTWKNRIVRISTHISQPRNAICCDVHIGLIQNITSIRLMLVASPRRSWIREKCGISTFLLFELVFSRLFCYLLPHTRTRSLYISPENRVLHR